MHIMVKDKDQYIFGVYTAMGMKIHCWNVLEDTHTAVIMKMLVFLAQLVYSTMHADDHIYPIACMHATM